MVENVKFNHEFSLFFAQILLKNDTVHCTGDSWAIALVPFLLCFVWQFNFLIAHSLAICLSTWILNGVYSPNEANFCSNTFEIFLCRDVFQFCMSISCLLTIWGKTIFPEVKLNKQLIDRKAHSKIFLISLNK